MVEQLLRRLSPASTARHRADRAGAALAPSIPRGQSGLRGLQLAAVRSLDALLCPVVPSATSTLSPTPSQRCRADARQRTLERTLERTFERTLRRACAARGAPWLAELALLAQLLGGSRRRRRP